LNEQPIPIAEDDDTFFEIYDWSEDACFFQQMYPAPYPEFPRPQPFLRFPFNTDRYREMQIGGFQSAFYNSFTDVVTFEPINQDFYTLRGYSRGPANLNSNAVRLLEYEGRINFQGGYFGGFLEIGSPNPLIETVLQKDQVWTFEMWVDPGHNSDPVTKIMDIGSRFDLPAGTLAPYSMGLYIDSNRTLVVYAMGPHSLDCSQGINFALQTEYDHPERSYAAAVQSLEPIGDRVGFHYQHVVATFDHQRYELSMWINGEFQGRAKMFGSVQAMDSSNFWIYLGRSLNRDREFGGELNFNGTVTELRFYNTRLSQQEIEYSLSQGPDPGPVARGYHTAVEFDSRMFFTGGYNPQENLRPYHDLWAVDTDNSNSPGRLTEKMQVDRYGPTLRTVEWDEFLRRNLVRFPMGHPLGSRFDLAAALPDPHSHEEEDF